MFMCGNYAKTHGQFQTSPGQEETSVNTYNSVSSHGTKGKAVEYCCQVTTLGTTLITSTPSSHSVINSNFTHLPASSLEFS